MQTTKVGNEGGVEAELSACCTCARTDVEVAVALYWSARLPLGLQTKLHVMY
jgi:hypothetical protein